MVLDDVDGVSHGLAQAGRCAVPLTQLLPRFPVGGSGWDPRSHAQPLLPARPGAPRQMGSRKPHPFLLLLWSVSAARLFLSENLSP